MQYNTTYKLWWEFCKLHNYSLFDSGVEEVIHFLQHILDTKTIKYGSFNSYRSALALILPDKIGENPILKRFLKGISNIRPTTPRYNFTWDTEPVLNFLATLVPLESLSFRILASKLATLLLLITGQRMQTIHLITLDNIIETSSGFQILITGKIKTSGVNSTNPCLHIPYYTENTTLCPATTLKFYLQKTEKIRLPGHKNLFLISKPPFSDASKETLSRWVKEILCKAGIDTTVFKTHSTRHASTSKAFLSGVSLDLIRKTAGWSNSSNTFAKFYNRPIIDQDQFAKSILD